MVVDPMQVNIQELWRIYNLFNRGKVISEAGEEEEITYTHIGMYINLFLRC